MKVLVIAPHADDEIFGVGGTISRLVEEKHHVTVAISSQGHPPEFPADLVEHVLSEARQANESLGVNELRLLELPITHLHLLPKGKLNRPFIDLVDDVKPNLAFLPFPGDRHEDHRQVFDAGMVALRPLLERHITSKILCYETVSETHWSAPFTESHFQPQVWVDISQHLSAKLDAIRLYASQVQPSPYARSLEAVEHLARWRGSVMGLDAAESFTVVRERISIDQPFPDLGSATGKDV